LPSEALNRIDSKEKYKFFLEADRIALGDTIGTHKRPRIIGDDIWKFLRLLRKTEYFINCKKDFFSKFYLLFLRYRLYKMSMKMSFYIPPNVCGPGLSIAQLCGPITINFQSTIGANCRISSGVIIGRSPKGGDPPKIGNHVFIGPNAVVVGPLEIADGIAIGANSYVSRSFLENGITIAGTPARKILDTGSDRITVEATEIVRKDLFLK
jgi:serine O-acetyltransferase